jgi:uncharacterized protein YndB with AHSA1/START domain
VPWWSARIVALMADPRDIVSVERVIAAPAKRIFDVLADPSRHPELDGSGTVQKVEAGAPARLSLGAKFGMGMRMGMPYQMVNTVTEFEENRRIAWSPKPANGIGASLVGRIWRYELEPVAGGTRVRETWDISREALRYVLRYVAAGRVRDSMTKSLERLEAIVTS